MGTSNFLYRDTLYALDTYVPTYGELTMKTTLKLKAVTTKNNRIYYYAFNDVLKQWQRISKDCFDTWSFQYFFKQKCETVSKTLKETVYLVTKETL